MKPIKPKDPSKRAIARERAADARHVAVNSRGLSPDEVSRMGDAVIAHRESELFHAHVPNGLPSPELDTMREVAQQAIDDFRATGVVSDQLLAIAVETQNRDVKPNFKVAGRKVIALAAQQKGKPAPSQAEFFKRPRVDTSPPTVEDHEVAAKLAAHARAGGNMGLKPRDAWEAGKRPGRNVDLVRDSDGKVIADDETVHLSDGEKFHTEPRVTLKEGELVGTVTEMTKDDDIADEIRREVRANPTMLEGIADSLAVDNAVADDVRRTESVTVPVPEAWKDHPAPAIKMAQALGFVPQAFGQRVDEYQPDRVDPVEAAVQWYSYLLPAIQHIARTTDPKHAESARHARMAWPHLANARVFAIPQATYAAVHQWADRLTSEEVAGLDWNPKETNFTEEESTRYVTSIREASRTRPFPEHLPFDDTVLVYGAGINIEHGVSDFIHNRSAATRDIDDPNLIAHLLTAQGDVWEFIVGVQSDDDRHGAIFFHQIRSKGEWEPSLSLMAWVVPAVVDLVNSFKALVREAPRGLSIRRQWEKDRRANERAWDVPGKKVPPPFYRVELRHELVEERLKEHGKRYRSWKLEHRCDVRGHERARVARGKLPLDPKLELRFIKRGYRVYTFGPPQADDPAWRLLAERHERPKAQDEWVAVKTSWVRPYIRGPADGPYIPSVRTLPKSAEK